MAGGAVADEAGEAESLKLADALLGGGFRREGAEDDAMPIGGGDGDGFLAPDVELVDEGGGAFDGAEGADLDVVAVEDGAVVVSTRDGGGGAGYANFVEAQEGIDAAVGKFLYGVPTSKIGKIFKDASGNNILIAVAASGVVSSPVPGSRSRSWPRIPRAH